MKVYLHNRRTQKREDRREHQAMSIHLTEKKDVLTWEICTSERKWVYYPFDEYAVSIEGHLGLDLTPCGNDCPAKDGTP